MFSDLITITRHRSWYRRKS